MQWMERELAHLHNFASLFLTHGGAFFDLVP